MVPQKRGLERDEYRIIIFKWTASLRQQITWVWLYLCQQPRVKTLLLSFPSSKAESLPPCADERRRDSEMQMSFKITPREGQTLTNPVTSNLLISSCKCSEVYQQQKQPIISNASILINWKVLKFKLLNLKKIKYSLLLKLMK